MIGWVLTFEFDFVKFTHEFGLWRCAYLMADLWEISGNARSTGTGSSFPCRSDPRYTYLEHTRPPFNIITIYL